MELSENSWIVPALSYVVRRTTDNVGYSELINFDELLSSDEGVVTSINGEIVLGFICFLIPQELRILSSVGVLTILYLNPDG